MVPANPCLARHRLQLDRPPVPEGWHLPPGLLDSLRLVRPGYDRMPPDAVCGGAVQPSPPRTGQNWRSRFVLGRVLGSRLDLQAVADWIVRNGFPQEFSRASRLSPFIALPPRVLSPLTASRTGSPRLALGQVEEDVDLRAVFATSIRVPSRKWPPITPRR